MLENWQPRSEFIRRLDAEAAERGLKEGIAQGMAQGRMLGERAVLLRQLRRRFGDLPAEVEVRISQADEARILAWSDALLDAPTLDAVFAG